jgi:ferric-dicitrate binding protein FerR (iron transport regulator)
VNAPRYATAAARLIRRYLPNEGVVSHDQARGVATIERAMHARDRRRRLKRYAGVLAGAAALLLIGQALRLKAFGSASPTGVVVVATPSGQGAAVRATESGRALATRDRLEAGQRIETAADGGASLQLSTGTSMALAGKSSFRVDSQGVVERFSLLRGELTAHVAKLASGQRFIVTTPDAEIEVRGTRFRLSFLEHPDPCSGTFTRLEVTEGVVELRAARGVTTVSAGQHWPADCAEPAPSALEEPANPKPHSSTIAKPDAPPVSSERTPTPEQESALLPANDLFADGVARRRQGDVHGALRVYQELLRRFPDSALAENAMVERMRLLARTGGSPARDEARRYLKRYPHGFAFEEAQRLAAEP